MWSWTLVGYRCWGFFVCLLQYFVTPPQKGKGKVLLCEAWTNSGFRDFVRWTPARCDGTQFIKSEATNSDQWEVIHSQEFPNKLRLHHKLMEWPEFPLLVEPISEKKAKEATVAAARKQAQMAVWLRLLSKLLRDRKYLSLLLSDPDRQGPGHWWPSVQPDSSGT